MCVESNNKLTSTGYGMKFTAAIGEEHNLSFGCILTNLDTTGYVRPMPIPGAVVA